jgi:23S rRNA (cytosine1962-C5)-methyltransferase
MEKGEVAKMAGTQNRADSGFDVNEQLATRRRALVAAGIDTEVFRLVNGAEDAMPGLFLDVLGRHWIAQVKDRGLPQNWKQWVDAGVCESLWVKQLSNGEKEAPICVAGTAPEAFVVSESSIKLEVQPAAGYSCGLFLDQRDNRRHVRNAVLNQPGARVLNLFSYTCSFSVAAALGGAVVTSVDLNAGYLAWGKRNFALNGLDAEAHHWIKGDSFDWLGAFAKKGRQFEGVVLDPPTFSRGIKKKVFRVEQDYAELVSLVAAVIAPGGWLLACANTYRMESAAFEAAVRMGLQRSGRKAKGGLEAVPMPLDFPGSTYLKCYRAWQVE